MKSQITTSVRFSSSVQEHRISNFKIVSKTNYAIPLIKVFLLVSILYFNTTFSQNRYESQLNIIFETFITKDFQLLNPILKPQEQKYLPKQTKTDLCLIAEQICLVPAPESYRIVGTEIIGNNEKIIVEYQYTNKVRFHYFTFSQKGKLIALEIVPSSSISL